MRSSKTVLVSRPAGQADGLLSALRQHGLPAFHQPLLALQPLSELSADQRQYIADLDRYHIVIFISTNAVRFGLDVIDEYWPQLPTTFRCYAVGAATAALLAERGLSPQSPDQQMDSEGLLALPSLAQLQDQRVLIVKGQGGRQALRDELSSRGAQVDELCCYQRSCPVLPAGKLAETLHQQQVGTMLISSGEGLGNLLTLLSERETSKFSKLALIVPSQRVAAMARQAGFNDVTVAANASDGAMLTALLNRPGGE
jgi:uroporphyrinogen-III synthase